MAVTSSPNTTMSDMIEIGFVRGAHGLRGQVVVHAHSNDGESLTKYGALLNGDGTKSFKLTVGDAAGNDFLCKIEGITDRNQAEALRGTKFFVRAADLPAPEEGEFYIKDLIGLNVQNTSGVSLGKVFNVMNLGNHDAIDIEFVHDGTNALEEKKTELLLFTKQNVPNVDLVNKIITVDLPFGLLDDVKRDA